MSFNWNEVIRIFKEFEGDIAGVGVICVLLLALFLLWRFHLHVVIYYKDEIKRVSEERDKWQDYVFKGKLLSSESDHYEKPPKESD